MNAIHRFSRGRRGGFTLIEVLVALSIFAGLMVALNVFIFSMAEAWGARRDERLFGQHVRAVTRHVEALFNAASRSGETIFSIDSVLRPVGGETKLFAFGHAEPDRIMRGAGSTLPDMRMALECREGTGLVLYWLSQIETRFGEDAWRETVISPFVVGLAYDYYDESFKTWQTEDRFKSDTSGEPQVPTRLRLRFKQKEFTDEMAITLPAVTGGLPAF